MNKVNIIKTNFNTHNNWSIVENKFEEELKSNKKILLISFVDEFFYKKNVYVKSDWVGILHDPEDTSKFHKYKNLFENKNFFKSLETCKGLFCMSESLKEYILDKLEPTFFVEFIYHPISTRDLDSFDFKKFYFNRGIIQIGNWLRKSYSIFKLNTKNKFILPYTERTIGEIIENLKMDKVKITQKELNSVVRLLKFDENNYNKIFNNNIIYLNLYNSTCNNVVLECIKSHCPILINRLKSLEYYLGEDYPFFYETFEEAERKCNDLKLIYRTHIYLKNLDKSKFNIEAIIEKINKKLLFPE